MTKANRVLEEEDYIRTLTMIILISYRPHLMYCRCNGACAEERTNRSDLKSEIFETCMISTFIPLSFECS